MCGRGEPELAAPGLFAGIHLQVWLYLAFGLAVGAGVLFATKAASRLLVPEDPYIGMAKVLASVLGLMAVCVALLTALFFWARHGLAPFGLGLVVGFLVPATIELVRFGGRSAVYYKRR